VNGTIARILDIQDGADMKVEVELADGETAEVRPHTWLATRPKIEGGSLRREETGSFTQLPFTLAWAITIHKSQGQTVDRLLVDLTGGTFACGQLYVALSRCTSFAGLVLKRRVQPKDLKTDSRIARFLRAPDKDVRPRRYCALEILAVGDEGRMSRPRPVEIAVAFDDGTALSTVINPERDLGNARQDYGINASDVLLAPTLVEAWALIAPALVGWTPVGIEIDETLGLIDYELKRLGHVAVMPMGADLPSSTLTVQERDSLSSETALERARAVLRARSASQFDDPGATAFAEQECPETSTGFLISRDWGTPPPHLKRLPAIAALIDVSQRVSPLVLDPLSGGVQSTSYSCTSGIDSARSAVASRLKAAACRAGLTSELLDRIRAAQEGLGITILDDCFEASHVVPKINSVLIAGARVCFTGSAQDGSGKQISRGEMYTMARAEGLIPIDSVTKAKCDALVGAELGSLSGKTRRARELGKPIYSAEEFISWIQATGVHRMR
jgi:ATP-dependent DNA helicase PIF1